MYGLLRLDSSSLSRQERAHYQRYLCSVCNALDADFGTPYRLLANYDLVTLAMVVGALTAEAPLPARCRMDGRCSPDGRCRRASTTLPGRVAAAAGVGILCTRLADTCADTPALTRLTPLIEHLWRRVPLSEPIRLLDPFDVLKHQLSAESEPQPSIESIAAPTAAYVASAIRCPAPGTDWPVDSFAGACARFLVVRDAFEDLAHDLASGSFNALRAVYPNRSDDDLESIADELLAEARIEMLAAVDSLPRCTEAALLRATVEHSVRLPEPARVHFGPARAAAALSALALFSRSAAAAELPAQIALIGAVDPCGTTTTSTDGCTTTETTADGCGNTVSESVTTSDGCTETTATTAPDTCGTTTTTVADGPCGETTSSSSDCGDGWVDGGGDCCLMDCAFNIFCCLIQMVFSALCWLACVALKWAWWITLNAWRDWRAALAWLVAVGVGSTAAAVAMPPGWLATVALLGVAPALVHLSRYSRSAGAPSWLRRQVLSSFLIVALAAVVGVGTYAIGRRVYEPYAGAQTYAISAEQDVFASSRHLESRIATDGRLVNRELDQKHKVSSVTLAQCRACLEDAREVLREARALSRTYRSSLLVEVATLQAQRAKALVQAGNLSREHKAYGAALERGSKAKAALGWELDSNGTWSRRPNGLEARLLDAFR